MNNSFSRQSNIKYGVPQASVLRQLLFNIDLIDLFYECKDSNITAYADDTTPHACGENIQAVISELQSLAFRLLKWKIKMKMKQSHESQPKRVSHFPK